jgi:hypothetical protein
MNNPICIKAFILINKNGAAPVRQPHFQNLYMILLKKPEKNRPGLIPGAVSIQVNIF